ncbi:hypothetical protein L7F22_002657 [Adiantum nelumboides]|nr:hypothetical protein [Adiantum nelumboides]
MAFPNFFGKQYESASNFLDDLEMAFLVSGRDEEEVKLRAFPLVLKDSAKNWFQNLEPGRKANWETLKETFLSKYGGLDNPEHLWHRISSLHQATSRTYLTYESQFLRLWAEWEASLAEGERAPNFLKKEKFLAGLFPDLQEKVKGKFPETFEEALQIARVKDRKLEYQAHTSRVEHPQGPTMADERLPSAPTTTPEDPHLELLQRVTNQLDNLSINMVQGVRQQQPQPNNERMPNGPRRQPQRRDYFCYNCGEEGHGMYFCPHPRNFNAQAGRGRQQVTPPRARPPPQIQPQILQNPQMVAQPQVLQRSVSPQPVAEIPPLPNNNDWNISGGTSRHDHGPDDDDNQDDPPSGTGPSTGGATKEPPNPPGSQSAPPPSAPKGGRQEDVGAAGHGGGSQKEMAEREISLAEARRLVPPNAVYTAVQEKKLFLKLAQPPNFKGEGVNVERDAEVWLEEMDDYFEAAGIHPQNQTMLAMFRLTGAKGVAPFGHPLNEGGRKEAAQGIAGANERAARAIQEVAQAALRQGSHM